MHHLIPGINFLFRFASIFVARRYTHAIAMVIMSVRPSAYKSVKLTSNPLLNGSIRSQIPYSFRPVFPLVIHVDLTLYTAVNEKKLV